MSYHTMTFVLFVESQIALALSFLAAWASS